MFIFSLLSIFIDHKKKMVLSLREREKTVSERARLVEALEIHITQIRMFPKDSTFITRELQLSHKVTVSEAIFYILEDYM